MTKSYKTIFTLLIILALGQLVFGQNKIIEEAELKALIEKAEKLRENIPFRKEAIIESFNQNTLKLNYKSINLYEVLPPDRSYSSHIYKSADKKIKTEYVTVGNQRFGRENDGEWKIVENLKESVDENAYTEISVKVVFVGHTKIGKKRLSLYEKVRQIALFEDGKQEHTQKYWFDENGYLIRESLKIEYIDNAKIYTKRSTYDYDAVIKIETPKVNLKQTK